MKKINKDVLLRIKFHKMSEVLMCHYDSSLRLKVDTKRIDQLEAERLSQKKKLNYLNYLMYSNLNLFKFDQVMPVYNVLKNNEVKGNDISKILMLFFPFVLDDGNCFKYSLFRNKNDEISKFKFVVSGKNEIQENVRDFLNSLISLKETKNYDFHRREIFSFLDSFLNLYVMDEITIIKETDVKNNFIYHYFRPFIRPEDYIE